MKLMLNGKEVSGMGHYVMAGDIKDATAEDSNVLSGKAYYNNNGKREGSMPNRGGMSAELPAGGSTTIPEGYHNGEGVVRAQDLASQTQGDAGAGNIDSGKTAWVNGVQVTGTSTKVDTSGATATAADIVSGKTAWVNGSKVTGTGSMDPWTVVKSLTISGGTGTIHLDYSYRKNYLKIVDRSGYVTIIPIYSIPGGGTTITLQGQSSSGSSATITCTLTYVSSSSRINILVTGNHRNAFSAIQEVSLA